HWERVRKSSVKSYERLAEENDLIIAEGAGSIAEINLHDRDLANVETAEFADASILLLGDIERGGVFASLYGTLELMPDDLQNRVRGCVITKFRGDSALLDSGIKELKRRTGVPVVGVLPYDDPGLPEEDSLSLPPDDESAVFGDEDSVPPAEAVTIGVPRLPHIANFTDLEPLARVPGVRVAYVPLRSKLTEVDAVVIPGTKNTVDDLLALRDAGFDDALDGFSGPVIGICGGYQMLGEQITNAAIEGTGEGDTVRGFDLLPVKTKFSQEKQVRQARVAVTGTGPIDGVTGTVSGFEIHMGRTTHLTPLDRPLGNRSAATESVLGTYLHGLFENESICTAFLDSISQTTDEGCSSLLGGTSNSPYTEAAELARQIDLPWSPSKINSY
ncbi:cobyric acid synthase, partial [Halococcus sediminicola]|uniref:cobyric acid synthase n=1 Tax=Halococcus sediminicola TaxID=1264579 RepID=UPI000679ADFC